MRRKTFILLTMVLAFSMLVMVSCSQSSFGAVSVDDKTMTVTAENASKDDTAVTGSLVVGEDEQITIDSSLDGGGMQIEFFVDEGFDDMEEEPDLDELQPAYTANVSGVESQAVQFGAGSFMVRATATEKKTNGKVEIHVKGFGG